MKCKQWEIGTYSNMGEIYYCFVVQFIFENHSYSDKIFITSQGSLKNFIKSSDYFFSIRDTGNPNEENVIKAKSNFKMNRIIVIPASYLLQGNKDVKFGFVWISDNEYKAKKYDKLISQRKKLLFDKLYEETKDISPASRSLLEREVNRHYKFDLIIKEKKELMKDVLTCKMAL